LRELLRPTSSLLHDVENFFLGDEILREERTALALSRWLDEAERVLSLAVQQRRYFDSIIEKYGANARVIPG
jgi:hypothetical protein